MIKFCIVLFALYLSTPAFSQELSVSDKFASKLSVRMKDSLLLDKKQEKDLFEINKLLAYQKSKIWDKYTQIDSLTRYIQLIENMRDSLYKPVLGEKKFLLYQKNKNILIRQ